MKVENKGVESKVPEIKQGSKKTKFGLVAKIISVIAVLLAGIICGCIAWYQINIQPVDKNNNKMQLVEVVDNSTSSDVATLLKDKGIIRNKQAFYIYARLSGDSSKLQAGSYRLSPSMNVADIVSHLVNGATDKFEITFYPGATLVDKTSNQSKKYAVTTVLKNAGYSDAEISTALAKKYTTPAGLFAGKPDSADLEGYIYGDTYSFETGASAEEVIQTALNEFYKVIQSNDLQAKFAAHNLTLYQGITLASIIQREASTADDQKQVAQIFYLRLSQGTMLGSDVTYQYIADKLGVTRSPSIDSPYNTRRYAGLPPGPISSPGLTALQAVASPASGNYQYFLSGDDGAMHYAYTEAEHNANIEKYCKVQCATN